MTRDEAVARVKVNLGFRRDLDAQIVLQLQDAQVFYEKLPILPWFLETEYVTATAFAPSTDAGTGTITVEERIPLPTNFIREKEDNPLLVLIPDSNPAYWQPVRKRDLEWIRTYYKGKYGLPLDYAISKDYFRLGPAPDQAYSVKLIYFKKDDVLTSNIENLWLKHYPNLFIGYAVEALSASAINSPVALARGKDLQQNALVMMLNETTWRDEDNRVSAMGQDL